MGELKRLSDYTSTRYDNMMYQKKVRAAVRTLRFPLWMVPDAIREKAGHPNARLSTEHTRRLATHTAVVPRVPARAGDRGPSRGGEPSTRGSRRVPFHFVFVLAVTRSTQGDT
jgi:hypothetical protein